MHLILFLVGIVLGITGAFLVHSSVPVVDVAAAALFNSGIIAIVGGLILMALAVVVRNVGRIAERFEIQPLPVPPVAAVSHEDPAPRPARAPAPPAAPAPKRPSLLSWFGTAEKTASEPSAQEAAAPQPAAPPPVDLGPLTRMPEEPRVAPPPIPPPRPLSPPLRAPVVKPPVAPAPAPAPPAPANGTPATTVYKSGVIDGMAYTLFMDGSIEAELPQGKVRFGSIDELQTYLTTKE